MQKGEILLQKSIKKNNFDEDLIIMLAFPRKYKLHKLSIFSLFVMSYIYICAIIASKLPFFDEFLIGEKIHKDDSYSTK